MNCERAEELLLELERIEIEWRKQPLSVRQENEVLARLKAQRERLETLAGVARQA